MLTAITGGIGSGKSIVSRILEAMGFLVYDCDSRAKSLMDENERIKESLCRDIHPDCVLNDGAIDRQLLSEIVFRDSEMLDKLNRIVHSAVREDFAGWCRLNAERSRLFVETAILYQSGLDRMVDDVWEVEAPLDLRVERVMKRNSVSAGQVMARIAAQDSFVPAELHFCRHRLTNDGDLPLLPQIEMLMQ